MYFFQYFYMDVAKLFTKIFFKKKIEFGHHTEGNKSSFIPKWLAILQAFSFWQNDLGFFQFANTIGGSDNY